MWDPDNTELLGASTFHHPKDFIDAATNGERYGLSLKN